MVARHGKLSLLFLDDEICEHSFLRELIAEADAVVIDAEAYLHLAVVFGLVETDQQLIIVIANTAVLAPDRMPCLVEARRCDTGEGETAHEVGTVSQLETESRRQYHGFALVIDTVDRHTVDNIGVDRNNARRRTEVGRQRPDRGVAQTCRGYRHGRKVSVSHNLSN